MSSDTYRSDVGHRDGMGVGAMTAQDAVWTMDYDGEITNSPGTCMSIAALSRNGSVVIGWTDEEGSHYDLLFAAKPLHFGTIQHGIVPSYGLFVGVIGVGCFAFGLGKHDTAPSYYAEKFGMPEAAESSTMVKLAELINGVREAAAR